jgi:hypothetical protein
MDNDGWARRTHSHRAKDLKSIQRKSTQTEMLNPFQSQGRLFGDALKIPEKIRGNLDTMYIDWHLMEGAKQAKDLGL